MCVGRQGIGCEASSAILDLLPVLSLDFPDRNRSLGSMQASCLTTLTAVSAQCTPSLEHN